MPQFHVLILEDDPIDVELITATLRNGQVSFSASVVDNRAEFIAAMESQHIDVVLADYSLPDFDGMSAIALVQSYDSEIPCILVSGALGEERAIEALKSGATDYVLKSRLERLEPAFTRAVRERQERLQLKATAVALQQSEERFRTSIEAMVDCLIILKAQHSPDGEISDFIVSYLNTAACEYLSISAKEQVGKPLYSVIPGFESAIRNSLFYAFCFTVDTGKSFQEEIFLNPQNNVSSETDLTKHQSSDSHLAKRVLAKNGLTKSSLTEPADFNQQFVALEMKASKLGDGIVVTWRDITVQKQIEQQRIQLLKAAERDRNEAETANQFKDEFIATLSHELRTPLNAIDGWIQLACKAQATPGMMLKAFEIIRRNTAMLERIISDLLDISRISQGKLTIDVQPIAIADFCNLIADTVETINPTAAEKNIEISASCDRAFQQPDPSLDQPPNQLLEQPSKQSLEQLVPDAKQLMVGPKKLSEEQTEEQKYIAGDIARLQQVIWNLLSNAIKFTPKGGSISITAQNYQESGKQFVVLSVQDTGSGINPTFLPCIFDRFQQAGRDSNKSSNGLGLGLSIVQHIVESHGGQIEAHSDGLNKGSLFKVFLSLRTRVEISHIQEFSNSLSQHSTEDQQRSEKIAASVLVGPSRANSRPASALKLDSTSLLAGIRVLVVEDQPDVLDLYKLMLEAQEAEVVIAASVPEALEQFHQVRPHIVISDIGLPGETGYDLIRKIRALPVEEGGQTPAVALSAYTEAPYRTRALLAGFQLHVPKPVDLEAIVGIVSRLAKKENEHT